MRNNLNVDRMHRNIARNTPDEIVTRLNKMDDDAYDQYRAWLKTYASRMRIKHPGCEIMVDMDDALATYTGETVIRARVMKRALQDIHVGK